MYVTPASTAVLLPLEGADPVVCVMWRSMQASRVAFDFGGWGDDITNDVRLFDPDTGRWLLVQDFVKIPNPRSQHSMVRRGSTLVMFGGLDPRGTLYGDLWQFDVIAESWTQIIASGDTPGARKGHASANIGDKLYVHGGTGPSGLLSDCWQYSFLQGQWVCTS